MPTRMRKFMEFDVRSLVMVMLLSTGWPFPKSQRGDVRGVISVYHFAQNAMVIGPPSGTSTRST